MLESLRIPQALLALGLAGLSLPLLPLASPVHADATPAHGLLLLGSSATQPLLVLKTRNLYRTEQRPYAIVPEGAAIWVRAPEGMTAADLHRRLSECTRRGDEGSPICIAGAQISVTRDRSLYVVHVKSNARDLALEIQRRAERL